MIAFAPCKINIGLRIHSKREDGFHNLESYFYPIPLYDILEIHNSSFDELVQTGIISTMKMEDNLVYKAILLLRKTYFFPPVKIHLHKQIPFQAGLGGGSSNAIACLKLLSSFFKLNIPNSIMMKMALVLGSDCPFFINAGAAKIAGRGENITPIDLSLSGKFMMIIKPNFSIDTKEAFQNNKWNNTQPLANILKIELSQWQNEYSNDFENILEKTHPEIKKIKSQLIEHGAIYASLSGSGSTVFGIFETRKYIEFDPSYFTWFGVLQ